MKVTDTVLEDFYLAVAKNNNDFIYRIHIPLSDVFYTRRHLQDVFGKTFTLDYIEWAMLKEGLIDPRHCHDPDTKLSWDTYPHQKEV